MGWRRCVTLLQSLGFWNYQTLQAPQFLFVKQDPTITSWRRTCQVKACVGKHCSVTISTAHLFAYVLAVCIYFHWILSSSCSFFESLSSALNLPLEKLRFLDIFICLWLPSWAIRYIPFENILTFHHSNVRSVYKFRDFIKTTSFVDCNWIEQRQFLVLALLSQLLLGWYFDLQPTCKNARVVCWGCSYVSSLEGCVLKISIFSWSSKPIYL